MIINVGEKVCVIERRYFVEDPIRFFTGEILASSENALRIMGYVWIQDLMKGIIRKPDLMERLMYPNERMNINIIPKDVNIDELKVVLVPGKGLCVTDSKSFNLDISEFGVSK
jgi:hypothetical protein